MLLDLLIIINYKILISLEIGFRWYKDMEIDDNYNYDDIILLFFLILYNNLKLY
jgi:hypothetical protein